MKVLRLLPAVILYKAIRAHRVIKSSDEGICASNETGSASNQDMLQCCISRSCHCYSFADLLANVNSNVTICVTTDMVLWRITLCILSQCKN